MNQANYKQRIPFRKYQASYGYAVLENDVCWVSSGLVITKDSPRNCWLSLPANEDSCLDALQAEIDAEMHRLYTYRADFVYWVTTDPTDVFPHIISLRVSMPLFSHCRRELWKASGFSLVWHCFVSELYFIG